MGWCNGGRELFLLLHFFPLFPASRHKKCRFLLSGRLFFFSLPPPSFLISYLSVRPFLFLLLQDRRGLFSLRNGGRHEKGGRGVASARILLPDTISKYVDDRTGWRGKGGSRGGVSDLLRPSSSVRQGQIRPEMERKDRRIEERRT